MKKEIKLHRLNHKEKLELAEKLMSEIGSKLSQIKGKLSAYTEMDHCKIDNQYCKVSLDVMGEANDVLGFCMNIRSHFIEELLKT